jgi:hypothetical protein
VVHGIGVLTFLAMIGACWRRRGDIGLGVAPGALGTVQLGLAAIIAHRAMRDPGLGRPREAPESP